MMTGFEQYTKKTRRAIFLEEMELVVPWHDLCALVEPHYPKPGNGRPPIGVERMLRIYFVQQWFNLSDPAVEETLYDSAVMRQFVGIDLGCEPVPDETTVCKFRHLLEEHKLGEQILGTVNLHLQARGVRTHWGQTHVITERASLPRTTRPVSTAIGTRLTNNSEPRTGPTRVCARRWTHEIGIRICEAGLPKTEEQRPSAVCDPYEGQPVSHRKESTAGSEPVDEVRRALHFAAASTRNPNGIRVPSEPPFPRY